jgi:AmmeMemoRadiSam system protein A
MAGPEGREMVDVYIPPDSQNRLLNLSRHTLENKVRGTDEPQQSIDDPYLRACDYGAFVSLHKYQELRGCIGTCFPTRPLYEVVIEMTQAAASRDHRVEPIAAAELHEIRISISVLSRLEAVRDPLRLEVGRHGLHVVWGENRGVLLPQVAAEFRWNMKSFLEHTCMKAGLPKDAWAGSDIQVSSFTTLIIEETT